MIGGEVYSTEKGKCNGIEVYLNPTATNEQSTSCTKEDYSKNSGTDKKEGCMKWYVYDVSDNGYTMILDHNTTATIDGWISESDYNSVENIGDTYGVTYPNNSVPSGDYNAGTDTNGNPTGGNNSKGPLTALKQLKTDTQDWTAIPNRTDTYTAETTTGNGYIIDYSKYKARLISAEEVSSIVRKSDWDTSQVYFYLDGAYSNSDTNGKWQTSVANSSNPSNYAWLFDNTRDCKQHGCNLEFKDSNAYGYWTSTARVGDSSNAWNVRDDGILSNNYVNITLRGIRPVITVSKSSIIS